MRMTKFKFITVIFSSLLLVTTFSSCASTSDTLRYHRVSEKSDQNSTKSRYGSKVEGKNSAETVAETGVSSTDDASLFCWRHLRRGR